MSIRTVVCVGVLSLSLGAGLGACKKKPPAEEKQEDKQFIPVGATMNVGERPMDSLEPMDAMKTPLPLQDAGVANDLTNKGMMPMKQLEDPVQ